MTRTWKGLDTENIGRPGIYSFVSQPGNKKYARLLECLRIEDERFRYFQEALIKLRELDEER